MSVRKAHNSGRNHLRNVIDYYQRATYPSSLLNFPFSITLHQAHTQVFPAEIGHEKAQSVIDSITSSYVAEGQAHNNPMLPENQPGGRGGFPAGMPFPPPFPGGIPPPGFPALPAGAAAAAAAAAAASGPGGPPPPGNFPFPPPVRPGSNQAFPPFPPPPGAGGPGGAPNLPPMPIPPPGSAGGLPFPPPGGLPFPPPGAGGAGAPPNFPFPPPGGFPAGMPPFNPAGGPPLGPPGGAPGEGR